jgi:hypothetical protein
MKKTIAIAAALAVLLAGSSASASMPPFTSPTPLMAGSPATITVDNTPLTWKTFIVMPGADFTPTTGRCYTNLRLSNGYAPRFVWACRDLTAPIQFTSPAVAPADLVADPNHTFGQGYVGLVGTGGMSRGAWTLSSPPSKFDYQTASSL